MSWRTDLAVLRHRDVRTFLSARFVSLLGSSIAPIALAFAVLDISGSAGALGLVLAARTVPMVVLMLAGGVIADRWPRHLVLVVANVVCALTQALAATLLLAGHAQIWQLVLIEVANGAAAAFVMPALTGILPALVAPAELPQANAVAGFARSTAVIGGGAVAGVIVAVAGSGVGLAIDAVAFGVAAYLLSRLSVPRLTRSGTSMLYELREGWSEFVARGWVWKTVLAASLFNLLWAACWITLGPVIADDTFGRAGWGAVSAAFGLGLVAGGVLVIRVKPRYPLRFGLYGLYLMVPAILCLALAPYTAAMVVIAFGVGVGFEMIGIGIETAIGQHIPIEKLSRVASYDMLGSFLVIPVGQLSVGYLTTVTSVRTIELYGAGLFALVVTATLAVPSIRRLQRLG
jgi:MFS family permease